MALRPTLAFLLLAVLARDADAQRLAPTGVRYSTSSATDSSAVAASRRVSPCAFQRVVWYSVSGALFGFIMGATTKWAAGGGEHYVRNAIIAGVLIGATIAVVRGRTQGCTEPRPPFPGPRLR
jgi:hypothetical protein